MVSYGSIEGIKKPCGAAETIRTPWFYRVLGMLRGAEGLQGACTVLHDCTGAEASYNVVRSVSAFCTLYVFNTDS